MSANIIAMPASIQAIATETWLQIIEYLTPDDYVNLALCCRRTYAVASGCLELHQKRVQKYTHVVFAGCNFHKGRDDTCHPFMLLKEMALDWRVAFYPRHFSVCCCRELYNVGPGWFYYGEPRYLEENSSFLEDRQLVIDTIRRHRQELINILPKAGCLRLKSDYPKWLFHTASVNRDETIALVFALLPNVEALNLTGCSGKLSCFESFMVSIADCGHTKGHKHKGPELLAKLSKIRVNGHSENSLHVGGESINTLGHLAALPSVRTLRGEGIKNSPRTAWRDDRTPSQVTEIILLDSCMSERDIYKLLETMKHLKSFTYEYNGRKDNWQGAQTHEVIAALHKYCRNTLENLDLKIMLAQTCGLAHIGGDSMLPDFLVLKNARIPSSLYQPFLENVFWKDGECVLAGMAVSIQKIELDGNLKPLWAVLTNLYYAYKKKAWSNLRQIVLHPYTSLAEFDEMMAGIWVERWEELNARLEVRVPLEMEEDESGTLSLQSLASLSLD